MATQNNSINTFKKAFFGGTRPNRFEITATMPNGDPIDTFHSYAFNLPEIAIGEIPVIIEAEPFIFLAIEIMRLGILQFSMTEILKYILVFKNGKIR